MGSTGFNFCNITYLTILKSLNCKLFRLKKSKSKNQKPKACPATKILISFEISSYGRFLLAYHTWKKISFYWQRWQFSKFSVAHGKEGYQKRTWLLCFVIVGFRPLSQIFFESTLESTIFKYNCFSWHLKWPGYLCYLRKTNEKRLRPFLFKLVFGLAIKSEMATAFCTEVLLHKWFGS